MIGVGWARYAGSDVGIPVPVVAVISAAVGAPCVIMVEGNHSDESVSVPGGMIVCSPLGVGAAVVAALPVAVGKRSPVGFSASVAVAGFAVAAPVAAPVADAAAVVPSPRTA